MSISTIFQLYRGGQFFVWRKSEYTESPTCCKSLTTLSHKVASSTPRHGLDSEVKAVYIAFVMFNDKLGAMSVILQLNFDHPLICKRCGPYWPVTLRI
jgi:hypothetical protein